MRTPLIGGFALPCLSVLLHGSAMAQGFIDDSTLKLQLRNVYFNENFRDENGLSARAAPTAKSERTEWAQGVLLDFQSGYTQGTVRPRLRCPRPVGREARLRPWPQRYRAAACAR